MNPGTSHNTSASTSSQPPGDGSGGRSQQPGTIQVSFMKNPKRKRLAKVPFFWHFSCRFSSLARVSPRPVILATRANVGVTALVRPASLRCINAYIDESSATSSLQQLVTTHALGRRFGRADACLLDFSSFYASKDCTYTDSSGRPVPAPKGSESMHQRFREETRVPIQPQAQEPVSSSPVQSPSRAITSHGFTLSSSTAVTLPPTSRKRRRSGSDSGTSPGSDPQWPSDALTRPAGLEANTVRDLVNCARFPSFIPSLVTISHEQLTLLVFFAHCHPGRMVIHKPTFMAALSQNRVPSHLILAICSMSAPFCQSPQVKSQPPRLAGIKFYEDALNILFDSSGRLICEANLQTVQTLCLLEMHDVVAQYSWTKCYRYLGKRFLAKPRGRLIIILDQDIATKILFETLDIASPESPPLAPKPTIQDMARMTERECARRCYWIIYFCHVLSTACTRNVRRFSAENMLMRLPVDETSFELGIQSQTPGKAPPLIGAEC